MVTWGSAPCLLGQKMGLPNGGAVPVVDSHGSLGPTTARRGAAERATPL